MDEMQVECKICNQLFAADKFLHLHLKAHKINTATYYQKHFPRYDLHSGEMINFKNKDQYFTDDFNNKNNLKAYVKNLDQNKLEPFLTGLLSKRKEHKNLVYAPTQVELRSLIMPSIVTFDKYKLDYYSICESIGLKKKFESYRGEQFNFEESEDYQIMVDTREQNPLRFKYQQQVAKLDFGDYTLNDLQKCCFTAIERKNLSDFIGTMSAGYDRFNNEIERAKNANYYLVVLIEESINDALSFNYLPHISKKIKATPEFIFHRVRELCQKYDNIQFVFADGRKRTSELLIKILTGNCIHKKYDLQLLVDKGII
jgi:hypothetical protein